MTDSENTCEKFKRRLLDLRAELQKAEKSGDEAARTVTLDQSRVGRLSRMDAMQSQAIARETQRRRKIQLQRTDAALKRINNDEFGFCMECGDEIEEKRLDFDPTAFLCIHCAENRER